MTGGLTLVIWRDWQRHRLRLVLTTLGIALGGAVFFAIQTVNTALVDSLNTTLESLGGRATLQVVAGESGFPLDTIQTVRSTSGITEAEPVAETYATLDSGERLLILGLDTESKLSLYSDSVNGDDLVIKDPAAFENHPDSILISAALAQTRGLKDSDKLPITTSTGRQMLTVRGIFKSKGIASVFGGNVAIMDLYAVQKLFGRGKRIDRVDIGTADGVNVDDVQHTLTASLQTGYDVVRPELRGKSLENSVTVLHATLTIMSMMGVIVSIFIIFNSFTISVVQRWKQIAVLRAIGLEARNVLLMLLGEAFVLGVVGSLAGLAAGMLIASFALKLVVGATQTIYGFVSSTPTLSFSYRDAGFTVGLGVVASVIGAWFPARSAAKMQTALALHDVEVRSPAERSSGLYLAIGLALIAAFWLIAIFLPPRPDGYFAIADAGLLLLGMVFVLPILLQASAQVLRPIAGALFGVEGAIAIDNIARAPRRTVATVAAIMLGLMFALSTASLIASQKAALNRSVDKAVAADMMVTSSSELHSRSFHLAAVTADKVAALPGVADADRVRISSMDMDGREVTIMAHEMAPYFRISPYLLDSGDPQTAASATSRGEGLLVSNNMAARWNLHLGDKLTLRSPNGEFALPIVGMLDYYRSENGTIFLDKAVYEKYWQDTDVDYILLKLRPGTDQTAFKSSVETALAGTQRAFVYTHDEYKTWVGQIIDQFFMMMYMQMIVAVIVALIGLINTMVISVAHRRRELGVFRAIGGLRRQVVKMVVVEAAAIAVIGMIAGVAAGAMNAYFMVKNVAKVAAGFNLPLVFPYTDILWSIPIVLVVAMLAAFWPARAASRMNVVQAIGYE